MSRSAPRVCVAPADTDRVVALIAALPAHGHVILRMRDGSTLDGVVHVRSSAQVFRDPHGLEGMNAISPWNVPMYPAPSGMCGWIRSKVCNASIRRWEVKTDSAPVGGRRNAAQGISFAQQASV